MDYERAARRLDRRHHGVDPDAVVRGAVPPGPILARLRSFPPVRGLVWGDCAEASPAVHELLTHAAATGAERLWRRMGCRSRAEALSFLTSQLRRTWGVSAAIGVVHQRHMRLEWLGQLRRGVQLAAAGDAALDGGAARYADRFLRGLRPDAPPRAGV